MATSGEVEGSSGEESLPKPREKLAGVLDATETRLGTAMIASYAVFSILLVIVTVDQSTLPGWVPLGGSFVADAVQVPASVYLFAALGACGYIFTRLIREFTDNVVDLTFREFLEMMTTVLAAIPLSAGVYLLSGFLFDASVSTSAGTEAQLSQQTMAGIAFLTGLFVKRAYQRLGWVADKLMPTGEEAGQVDIDEARTGGEEPDGEAAAETDADAETHAGDTAADADSETDAETEPATAAGDSDDADTEPAAGDGSAEDAGPDADDAEPPPASQ